MMGKIGRIISDDFRTDPVRRVVEAEASFGYFSAESPDRSQPPIATGSHKGIYRWAGFGIIFNEQ
jgi:hypothetical protein